MSSLPLISLYPVLGALSLVCISWVVSKLVRGFLRSKSLHNLPGPPATSFITGSLDQLYDKHGWKFHQHLADNYGAVVKIKGLFGAEALYIHDPKALNHILLKDQNVYEETSTFIQMNRMFFGEGIFTSLGERHRLQRKMLNPVFSIAHMRNMVNMFHEVSHRLHDTFRAIAKKDNQEVDIVSWMTRLALELIGQSGLGFSFDTLTEGDEPHPYGIAAKKLFPLSSSTVIIRDMFAPYVAKFENYPRLGRFMADWMPFEAVADMKFIVDTMYKTSIEIYEGKKAAIQAGDEALKHQVGRGKDVMSILLKANMFASEGDKLSEKELLGQVTSLTFAATDTTSSALSRTLHLLATHQDVQEKLRQEIRNARKESGDQDLSYDTLVGLPYLDAVCRETLRLYPSVPMLNRITRADNILPLSTPIKGIDGTEMESLEVPNGTEVFISILGSNRNPELWGPDVLEWKPERWLNALPEALVNARVPGIYSHLMTFIGGGRSCIGFKFSQLEMKAVLSHLLEDIEFSLTGKEIHWHMNLVVTPTTDRDSLSPTMPLKIRYVGN